MEEAQALSLPVYDEALAHYQELLECIPFERALEKAMQEGRSARLVEIDARAAERRRCLQVFRAYDRDGDGKLTMQDIEHILMGFSVAFSIRSPSPEQESPTQMQVVELCHSLHLNLVNLGTLSQQELVDVWLAPVNTPPTNYGWIDDA